MAKIANLKGKFTNHSLRRTCCTTLVRAGIPLTVVAQLTGHKNIGSLLRYTTASKNQQKEMCEILQGKRKLDSLQNQPEVVPVPKKKPFIAQNNRLIPATRVKTMPKNPSSTQVFPPSTLPNPNTNALNFNLAQMNHEGSYIPAGLFQGANIGSIGTVNIHMNK